MKGFQIYMNLKKVILTFCILLIIYPNSSLADEYSEDEYIENDYIVEVSSLDMSNTPNINAKYAIVLDRASKTILYGKNENSICKMASTTKILTAIIVLENCSDLNSEVIISKKAARYRWFAIRTFSK